MRTDKEINQKAFNWAMDYKPWVEDLEHWQYAQEGFRVGYKRALEENKVKERGEYIICSAIFINDNTVNEDQPTNIEKGFVISGRRHHNCYATLKAIVGKEGMDLLLQLTNHSNKDHGFITSLNRFVDRKEGMVIAKKENQLLVPSLHSEGGGELTSEDLFLMDYATMKY